MAKSTAQLVKELTNEADRRDAELKAIRAAIKALTPRASAKNGRSSPAAK